MNSDGSSSPPLLLLKPMRTPSGLKEEEAKLAATLKMAVVPDATKAPAQTKVLTKSGSAASAGSKASRTASKESKKRSEDKSASKSKSKLSMSKSDPKSSPKLNTKIKKRRSTNKKRLDKPMVFDDFVLQGFGTGKTPQDHEPSK